MSAQTSGCNHMSCKICKHEFCWMCKGSWKTHGDPTGGFYKCNLYDPLVDYEAKLSSEQQKRLLHFTSRFDNHRKAYVFAAKAKRNVEELRREEKDDYIQMKLKAVSQAYDKVMQCRRILKNTYVYAYFLPDGPDRQFFEHLQQMLEKNTEYLQELVEKPVTEISVQHLKSHMQSTSTFCTKLIDGVRSSLLPAPISLSIA
jgi:ariadne-1